MNHLVKTWIERFLNALPGIILPVSIIILSDPKIASEYFLISVALQSCMQVNYIFGIEYQSKNLKIDNDEIGKQNLARVILPLILGILLTYLGISKLSPSNFIICYICIALNEIYVNYRYCLVIRQEMSKKSIAILSSISLLISPTLAYYSVKVTDIFFYQSFQFIAFILFLKNKNLSVINFFNLSWFLKFFKITNMFAPFVWYITRADRLISLAFNLPISSSHLFGAAISDSIFSIVRQTLILTEAKKFINLILFSIIIWIPVYLTVIHFKALEFNSTVLIAPILQIIAMIIIKFNVRRIT